jgi:DnaJ homolog subfamily C member 9
MPEATLILFADKVTDDKKSGATEKFQEIAFAYAVLSDPARRKRYDETGSTSEAIVDSDGFSWTDFYRAQFQEAISSDAIEKFAKAYKNSEEEKDDILAAYEEHEGDMTKLYETVILSNVLEDDDRFRQVIDDAIVAGTVPAFTAYTKETKKSKQKRVKDAQAEANEAEEYAKELGVHDKLFNKTKKGKKEAESDLAALIQRNQQNRASTLIDQLEQKYGAKPKSTAGKKRSKAEMHEDDIPDYEFEAVQAKMLKKAKDQSAKKQRSGRNRD